MTPRAAADHSRGGPGFDRAVGPVGAGPLGKGRRGERRRSPPPSLRSAHQLMKATMSAASAVVAGGIHGSS
jgi:hypothetical protein